MSAAVFAIWRQALIERRARGGLALTWILLGLAVLGLASVAVAMPKRVVLMAVLTAVPIGALLLMWWIYLCASVMGQCHRAALQLVPRLHQATVAAVLAAWLAIVAMMTSLAGVPTGCAPQVAIVTALVLVETSFLGSLRAVVVGVLLLGIPNLDVAIIGWLGAVATTPEALLAGVLLVMAEGTLALRRLANGHRAAPPEMGMAALFEQRAHGPGGRAAGRLERGPDRQPAFLQPLGRSWFGGHWPTVGLVVLACVAIHLWNVFKSPAEGAVVLATGRTMIALLMLGLLGVMTYRESQRFASARTEQSLLCLAPAALAGPAMNRMLARLLLAGFARTWLTLWLLTMVALAVLEAPVGTLARLSAVWAVALALLAFPLRDHARAQGAPGFPGALLCAVLAGAAVAAVHGRGAPACWLAVGVTGVLAGCALAGWRGRAMLAAPPALPAGRVR